MTLYHKINGLFHRSATTKKLIEGEFREPSVEFLKDNQWIFAEKIDGTNIRIIWDGHEVSFGGRKETSDIPKDLLRYLKKEFGTDVVEQMFEEYFPDKTVILFGEGYGAGINGGGGYRKDKSFILFDVMVGDTYVDRSDVEDIAKIFDLDVVPIMLEGTIQEAVDFVKTKPLSLIAEDKVIAEGVVGTPKVRLFDHRGKRIIVKIKHCDFDC